MFPPSQNILLVVLLTHIASNVDALKFRVPLQRHRDKPLPRRYRRLDVQDEASRQPSGVRVLLPDLSTANLPVLLNTNLDHIKDDLSSATLPGLLNTRDRIKNESIPEKKPGRTAQQIVSNVHELREKVLDENIPLRNLQVDLKEVDTPASELMNHEVVNLIAERFRTESKPGARAPDDTAVLALSIEGGGMRACVCSGMAAAIACLGLTDSFDAIYGSSAGSVIGAYMVSRQMCVDVYVDILPAAKKKFVCKKRMFSKLAVSTLDLALSLMPADLPKFGTSFAPGMNISYVLDDIMDDSRGIRPLDMESLRANDQKQPLRVASSYVKDGKLYTKCFGSENFFPGHAETVRRADGRREGIYACLEASMTVPGATGDPVRIVDSSKNESSAYFDAFCFEPLPYRSAVEEGATHVLVLCSRPEGFQPKSVPGVYERGVAPLYFRSHGEPKVADFFKQGGQQYIYAEDLLTLEEGKRAGISAGKREGVRIPPPKVLYGVKRDAKTDLVATERDGWKKAHLLPLKVPIGTKELRTLEQGRDEVSEAVRSGFAAAFDLLAPVVGLELDESLTGTEVAKLLFPPDSELDEFVLQTQLRVKGDLISSIPEPLPRAPRRKRDLGLLAFGLRPVEAIQVEESVQVESLGHAEHLLSILPGFASGKMTHLSANLRKGLITQ